MPKNLQETLYRDLCFERAGINAEGRTIELTFASEEPVIRTDWWGDSWKEILGHEPGNVDLARLSQMGVLLFNHNPNQPVGQVISPRLDNGERKCKAQVRFDTDADSEKIYQKVLSGTLKGVSVGYRVTVWEEVKTGATSSDGRFAGPCYIARKWEPTEISIVSVPADTTVGVGRSLDNPSLIETLKPVIKELIAEGLSRSEPKLQSDKEEPPNLSRYYLKLSLLEKSI